MKSRTKAAKRKKMAGTQKARDMVMGFVVVESDVEGGKEAKRKGRQKHAESLKLFIMLGMERSKRREVLNPEMPKPHTARWHFPFSTISRCQPKRSFWIPSNRSR